MRIKRLRLAGFKSFVEPAELVIRPGLTGVVGPNGCGKSNLLEALRWAMGEGSPKSLRGAGMEDVIFAGTARRPPRDFAEVTIAGEIDGDDGPEEIEIVRRIERGAGSAYRVDGRDVRAKDVALLFADAATGAHSPALVSQNRIGAVIAARPAERRAMLEEAAGIAGLHVRRRDAEGRLRATEVNLERLDTLVADGEARAAALRRQARQAERYRLLSDEIRIAEARMIFARWREAAAAAETAKSDLETCTAAVSTANHALTAAAEARAATEAALAKARERAGEARDRATAAGHVVSALRREHAAAEQRLRELADAARRIEADHAREATLTRDAGAALARLGEERDALEARIAASASALPALETARDEAEHRARLAEAALAEGVARQAADHAERRIAEAALTAARTRLDRATQAATAVEAARAALPKTEPLLAARVAAHRDTADADAAADANRARIAAAEAEERDATRRRDVARAERAAAAAEVAALESEARALERATRAAGGDRMLDRVRAAPGYERALAAALGDDLAAGLDPAADTHWAGAPIDEPPAAGPVLAAHVTAPPQLARRLAQVLVMDADDGRALAPGQRLVTVTGVLRRWDGLIARAGGTAAAERLQRLNRLDAIAAALPPIREVVSAAETALAAAEAAIAGARATLQAARQDLATAELRGREARTAADRAGSAIERLVGQRADLDARAVQVAAERVEAMRDVDLASAALATLPSADAATAAVATGQREASGCREAAGIARARLATAARSLAADRERRSVIEAEARSWQARADDAAARLAGITERATALAAELETRQALPATLQARIADAESGYRAEAANAAEAADIEQSTERDLRDADAAAHAAGEALAAAREARAGALARHESQELRRVEMGRLSGERFECPAPVLPTRAGFASDTVSSPQHESAAHERLMRDRDRIGPVNLVAEQELAELVAGAVALAAERAELAEAIARLRGSIGHLNREGRQRLQAAFEAVDGHFRRLFTALFDGGQANLALIESDDPLEAGLEIMAQPPGKRLQSLTLLSGGEQALTAVALIFALFLTNPSPICVLDEVDAPLDDANIERFCDLLDRMADETETRYLVVTHNAVTMSRMHRLFGVTMVEQGVSRLVSVDLGGATALAAE